MFKKSHADVSVFFLVVCTRYQIQRVSWLSGEDAPSNICTVLVMHHCSEEFRLSATVAMYCDTFDACNVAVIEMKMK